eukprot:1360991-Pyramimonas_sp.AAC.1
MSRCAPSTFRKHPRRAHRKKMTMKICIGQAKKRQPASPRRGQTPHLLSAILRAAQHRGTGAL